MPSQIVTTISDLHSVLLTVRVHYGWRALAGSWIIRLGAWVGGAKLEFLGEKGAHDE